MLDRFKLNNGLNVVIDKDENSKIATFCYLVNCGSFFEDDSNRGIAHFTEHMLFKGTTNRDFSQINKDIENIGGMLNAETSFDYTRFYNVVPCNEWKIGLDVASDLIWNNTIPEEEFEKEKNVVIQELIMYDDDPEEKALENFNKLLSGDYENRKLIGGTPETVSNITREDMINFIDKFYTPSNITLVITGNVNKDEIVDYLNNNINIELKKSEKTSIGKIDTSKIEQGEVKLELSNINQSHVVFGTYGPCPSDEDYAAFEIISGILGGNSSSKLYHLIREVEGLAYTVYTRVEDLFDCSQFIGYVGLNKEEIPKCKKIILEQIDKICKEGITEEELKNTVCRLKGNSLLSLEKCSSKNSYICNSITYNYDPELSELFKKYDEITTDDIKRVANKYIPVEKISFSYVMPED